MHHRRSRNDSFTLYGARMNYELRVREEGVEKPPTPNRINTKGKRMDYMNYLQAGLRWWVCGVDRCDDQRVKADRRGEGWLLPNMECRVELAGLDCVVCFESIPPGNGSWRVSISRWENWLMWRWF